MRKHNIELVAHLAAKAGVRPSLKEPQEYIGSNIDGTVALLESMREVGISKIVLASSSKNREVNFSIKKCMVTIKTIFLTTNILKI